MGQWRAYKMREWIGKQLHKFFDAVDIGENLKRMTRWLKDQPRDFISSVLILLGSALMTYVCALAAWKFDFESTYNALDVTREFILGTASASTEYQFPTSIQSFSFGGGAILAFTLFPTIMEIVGAAMAKAQIEFVRIGVIALSVFDIVTDIPTVTVFMMKHAAFFDSMGIVGTILYPIVFILWLIMATFGFEILTIIFTWASISMVFRMFAAYKAGNWGFEAGK